MPSVPGCPFHSSAFPSSPLRACLSFPLLAHARRYCHYSPIPFTALLSQPLLPLHCPRVPTHCHALLCCQSSAFHSSALQSYPLLPILPDTLQSLPVHAWRSHSLLCQTLRSSYSLSVRTENVPKLPPVFCGRISPKPLTNPAVDSRVITSWVLMMFAMCRMRTLHDHSRYSGR